MYRLLYHLLLCAVSPLVLSAGVETWTGVDGRPMQAEFIGVKGDYVVFQKADGTQTLFPLVKLSAADRARIGTLQEASPAQPASDKLSPDAMSAKADSASTMIASQLAGRLVAVKNGKLAALPKDHLAETKVFAVYFSALWCSPCRAFTPELVNTYKQIKAAHPEFELIFVSSDRKEQEMQRYMVDYGMPWVALTFREVKTNSTLLSYRQNGIPNLVFIDGSGKVLSKTFDDNGKYLGPQKVLRDIRRHFRM